MKTKQLTEGSSLFLDIVRALSVQLVVIGHGISYCNIALWAQPPSAPYMQNIAVVVFFVLSGYLISNSIFYKLSTDINYSFRTYFIARFSRIYAALIPALIFIFILDFISIRLSPNAYLFFDAFNLKTLAGNILMLQDFPLLKYLHLKLTTFGSARPLWTLAIEWWIYMWFGVLMIHILRKNKRSVFSIACFILLSIVPAYNLFTGRGHGLTLFWLFGVLIVLTYEKYKQLQLSPYMKLSLLLLILLIAGVRIAYTNEAYDPIFAFLLTIAITMGMDICSGIQFHKNTASIIRMIANYSYTLYLIHYTIYDFILNNYKNETNSTSLFFIGFIVSNILSLIIGYYAETKLTKWLKTKLKAKFS